MEYRKGKVKNTPIQHPIKPTNEPINATIINPSITKGCLKISKILYFIASIAFKSPKITSGVTRSVIKEIK